MSKIIAGALTKGEAVQLVGFSTFPAGERAAPTGRNSATGAELPIPAGKV